MDVHLLVYDLSNGLARSMSMALLGFQLDAVYHTSIELDGTEWVYDGGINTIRPGTSHLGKALQRIHLGKTQLLMEVIIEYVDSLRDIFTAQVRLMICTKPTLAAINSSSRLTTYSNTTATTSATTLLHSW